MMFIRERRVVRGCSLTTHPDGTSATPQTIATLLNIAREYRALSGSKLSVNDRSLPAGGLFDIFNTWMPAHLDHRTGTDADINQLGIDCLADESFRKAIATVAASGPFPKRLCESGGRKHINFD